jgi:hypothetical protein
MTVYVDDMRAPFGRMKMSHLWADTPEELFEMIDKIGVQRKWLQMTSIPHFDVAESKRQLAIENGAVSLVYGTNKEWVDAYHSVRDKFKTQESREPFIRMSKGKKPQRRFRKHK